MQTTQIASNAQKPGLWQRLVSFAVAMEYDPRDHTANEIVRLHSELNEAKSQIAQLEAKLDSWSGGVQEVAA